MFRHTYIMLWPLSMAPESACRPISYVAPSPAKLTNLISSSILPFLFRALYAVSSPAQVAAPFPKAVWMYGVFQDV